MWRIDKIETRPRVLEVYGIGENDFAQKDTYSLHAQGVELSNDIAIFSTESTKVRVVLCHCGCFECGTGDWVCLRSLGDHVIWIPDFESLEFDQDSVCGVPDDTPPDYLGERGMPFIAVDAWNSLRQFEADLLSIEQLPPLSWSEAIRIVQAEDPEHALGESGRKPELAVDKLIAVTGGDLKSEIQALSVFIDSACASSMPVAPSELARRPVEFHLDAPGFPSWSPFSRTSAGWAVELPNGPVVTARSE